MKIILCLKPERVIKVSLKEIRCQPHNHQKEEFNTFNFLPSLLVLYLPIDPGSGVDEVGL